MPSSITDLQQVNSVSYADVVGLSLGLERLGGETTTAFVQRMQRAARSRRDHSYQGAINDISLSLGLEPVPGIRVTPVDPTAVITVSIAGVRLVDSTTTVESKLVEIDPACMWAWRMLSDVVADLNASGRCTAELLVADAPALQIANQSNIGMEVGVVVDSAAMQLKGSVIADSVLLSAPSGVYQVTPNNVLVFASSPVAGLTVSYRYQMFPFEMVTSPVRLTGLVDPNLASVASQNGAPVYQLREAVQAIAMIDRSYWSE